MKKALLIGGTGFAGQHLARLLEMDHEVVSVGSVYDVADKDTVMSLVKNENPDVVVHMAAITTVRESIIDPDRAFQIGFFGLNNLIQALKKYDFQGRLLNISSSEVYGFPDVKNLPLKESAPLRPMSPYAVTKIATEALSFQQSQTGEVDIVTARPFTHIGPGQSGRFAMASFAKQITEVKLGLKEPIINVGNLESTRDILDVRDVAAAYKSILNVGITGEVYNVCSDKESRMIDLLDRLIEQAGIHIEVKVDKNLVRKQEQQRILGCSDKLRNQTGWQPGIRLEQTFADMLHDWERVISDKCR